MAALLFIAPLRNLFKFEKLDALQMVISIVVGFISVIWYEAVKFLKRRRTV
jgi:Ca2+-transporting ATPase